MFPACWRGTLPPAQNAIERLHEEFKRRIKAHELDTLLPWNWAAAQAYTGAALAA